MKVPYDVVGDIAIMKFSRSSLWPFKKFYAWKFLKKNKNINVVLEKTEKFSGELRTQKTKWILGEKRKETIHRENECSFYLNVDSVYFSPRLSQDRKIMSEEVLKNVKNNSKILVMFSGISPFPIVLAKGLKKNKISVKIISSELNKDACEYGQKNIKVNKIEDYVEIICKDSKELCKDFNRKNKKFDYVFMLRPNLDDTFLSSALSVSKKGTIIYYHGFAESEDKIRTEIKRDISRLGIKISKLDFRKAGDIGVRKFRFTVRFKVLKT